MQRRSFLRTLFGGAVTAATLDSERLLWTPKARVISIPMERPVATAMVDKETGLTLRFISKFDESSGLWLQRIDRMYGWKFDPDSCISISC